MTPTAHTDRLIAVARQVVEALPDRNVRAAVLYGSVAWGDADAASDLDIMLLLDQPAVQRTVARERVADLLGHPLPHGPLFADLDRVSTTSFEEAIAQGDGGERVTHSIILRDTESFYARIQGQVSATFFQPPVRAARFEARRVQAEVHRTALQAALGTDDLLAALHARLAVQEAGAALIALDDGRYSTSHAVESTERALQRFGADDLVAPFHQALALEPASHRVTRSLRAYAAFADALKSWVEDPSLGGRLSVEDQAWAEFTYGPHAYEELGHKVSVLTLEGRVPVLLSYLDGLLLVPVRINIGKMLALRTTGTAAWMTIPEFHGALSQEAHLYQEWIAALRLSPLPQQISTADDLARRLLEIGRAACPVASVRVP